ncbi:MAG: hypothetical protein WC518_01890 [Patescibacteria group bacterium]
MSQKTGILLLLLRPKDGAAVFLDWTQNALFMLESASATGVSPLAEREDLAKCMKGYELCPALGYGLCARCPMSVTGGALCNFWASQGFARVLDARTEEEATFADLDAMRAALTASITG